MIKCPKCKKEVPNESVFCMFCGKKIITASLTAKNTKQRGNGQGSVYKLPNGKWRCAVTVSTSVDENGKVHRVVKTKSTFKTKKEAVDYVHKLYEEKTAVKKYTFKEMFDLWIETHEVREERIDYLKKVVKKFSTIWNKDFDSLKIDDYQKNI